MRKEPTSNLLTEYFYTHSFLLFFSGEWCHGSRQECMLNLNATEEFPWASRSLCIILLNLWCIACKPFPYISYSNTLFWILNLLRNCKSFFFFLNLVFSISYYTISLHSLLVQPLISRFKFWAVTLQLWRKKRLNI